MCRQDSRCIRDFLPEPANRVPLVVREAERVLGAEQVRAPDAAEEHRDVISLRCPMAASCRRRKSYGESSWWEMTPLSPQALHCHWIGVPASGAHITIIRPGQAR